MSRSCSIEIVTGKGLHSQGQAVLYPKMLEYLSNSGFKAKGKLESGKIAVTILAGH